MIWEIEFSILGARGAATFDFRNNKLDPSKGFFATLEAQPFQEFKFGNTAGRLLAEGRVYRDIGSQGRSIIAARAKVGTFFGAPIAEAPPDQLFLAGGGDSVRGYAFKSIGIDRNAATTTGGRSLLEGSVEFRQKFTDTFGAVIFADAGTVGADPIVDLKESVRVGIGAGLRYYTGLGPIRLDVAFPLDPGRHDEDFAIYAGIGQAF